ncbi:hypothetical protein ACTUVK_003641 [Stenotrophomonas rhizophila]|jgi:hypothetical protein|uniref:Transmembrane protein n=1 Tax=Stenotrophomonas nematodicola TaxID=2656746 RepID=A0ABW7CWW2_9GAMM|nr:hypothetical protein [Stenotrophomonas sp. BIGb0135]MCS4236509.1 hypothetical protein [Stenotrophomonas sp. BIGb0135]
MNKGIPYLLAVLVALTLSAGWAAPVLALFEHAYSCLQGGGGLDLVRLRCEPRPDGLGALLGSWPFWATAAGLAASALAATRLPRWPRSLR